MFTTKILILVAFILIGVVVSDSTTCGAVTSANASPTTCDAEKDNLGSCCYQTYTVDTTSNKGCLYVAITDATSLTFASFYDGIVSANPTWKDYKLDCGFSSSDICTSVNAYTDTTKITKESCNNRTDSANQCCFQSYTGTNLVNGCLPLSSAEFSEFQKYIDAAKSINTAFKDYSLDCGQSFITISLMILALFGLLF